MNSAGFLSTLFSVAASSPVSGEKTKLPHGISPDIEIGFRHTAEALTGGFILLLLLLFLLLKYLKKKSRTGNTTPPPPLEKRIREKITLLDNLTPLTSQKNIRTYYDTLSDIFLTLLSAEGVSPEKKPLTYDELKPLIQQSPHFDEERKEALIAVLEDIQKVRYASEPPADASQKASRKIIETLFQDYLQRKRVEQETVNHSS